MSLRAFAVVSLVAVAGPVAAQPTLTGVGQLSGFSNTTLSGLSANGVAVGRAGLFGGTTAFRWTAAGGIQDLGTLAGTTRGVASGVSADGAIVFGVSSNSTAASSQPFRWTAGTGLVALGVPAGFAGASIGSPSADGTAAAVQGFTAGGNVSALRWASTFGYQTLSMPTAALNSFSQGMSADGTTVVGGYDGTGGTPRQAFRWTQPTGGQLLAGLPTGTGTSSTAYATTPDGQTVVGTATPGAGLAELPFRWSATGGYQSLGTLAGGTSGGANAVSADGGVVVGTFGLSGTTTAFVYDAAGIRDLNAVAAGQGVDLTGWTLLEAATIAGNSLTGYTIAGTGSHNGLREGFLITNLVLTPVPEPATVLAVAAAGLVAARRFRRR